VKKNSRRTPKEATKGGGGKRGIHPVEAAELPASGMLTIVAPSGDGEMAEQKQIRVEYLREGEEHPAVHRPHGDGGAAQVAAAVTGMELEENNGSEAGGGGKGVVDHPAVAEAPKAPVPPPAPSVPSGHENRSAVSIGEEAMKSALTRLVVKDP